MKLNLEIDLEWIDEDSTLDETIRKEIIGRVVNKIQNSIEQQVTKNINKTIDRTVIARINKATDKMFRDFMKRSVSLTDSYGSTIKTYKNVTDVIKERFDNFMKQKVNENGNISNGYGKEYPRLQFIIDKQLKDFADKFTTDAVKKVSEEIKTHVKDGLTNKLGSELMKVLKVNEMLALKSTNGN